MRAIQYLPHFILISPFAKRFLTLSRNKLMRLNRALAV
ncbi:hypothetical protein P20495_2604 [Pseudoalteromonas sp. BSi20495]|nr:hypothetical protein P20495_2604 [Pseudoalteromonas sp. BSi20495]